MKDFFSFIFSKVFLKHLMASIVILTIGLVACLLYLNKYTRHGEEYSVPDIKGLKIDQAKIKLEENHMNIEIYDSLYLNVAKPGEILEQMPKEGHKVKEGRKIYVTICATKPEQIKMPNVTDISFRQAVNLLQASGLKVGNIKYESSRYENLVLYQERNGRKITVGEKINKGDYVDLVVGRNGSTRASIPNLVGLTLHDANTRLLEAALSVGAVLYDETIINKTDSLNAKIWRQSPEGSSPKGASLGSLVDIWLTANISKINTNANEILEDLEDEDYTIDVE